MSTWLRDGVLIRSLGGLHAKVLLLDSTTAVVGSANLSINSRDHLHEAALITDDPQTVEQVSDQLDRWWQSGTKVDDQWIELARKKYRDNPLPATRRQPLRRAPSHEAPLWICQWSPSSRKLSSEAEEELASATALHQDLLVESFLMHRSDRGKLLEDHAVVMINNSGPSAIPHGNSATWAPATVVRVVDQPAGPPVAILVHDLEEPVVRFGRLRSAVVEAGGTLRWDAPLPPGPVTAAVRALWPQPDHSGT